METKIVIGLLLILTLVVSLGVINNKPKEKVTIVAFYNQYACGDDNIYMKVKSVDNPHYQFVVDKDVAPLTNFFTQRSLIDFVKDKTLQWQQGQAGEYLDNFILIGHFKDSKEDTECSSAREFVVNKIKYGTEKEFREF